MKRTVVGLLVFFLLLRFIPFLSPFVVKSISSPIVYDFISNAGSANWSSGAGALPFPGSESDSRGFALLRTQAVLEDSKTYSKVLETHPQWVDLGWIQGIYPQLTVPTNAKLNVTVGFLKGATNTDGVIFRMYFRQGQTQQTLFEQKALYDNKLDTISVDLSSIAGKTGNFILYVNAFKGSGQDWAVWASATIEQTVVTLPDLTITDIRRSGSTIYYTIKNIGDASVGSPNQMVTYSTALFIDGSLKALDQLNTILQPGQSVEKSFNYQYSISGTEDIVKVCADYNQNVNEKDESNNCKEVKWTQELPDLTVSKIYCSADNRVTFTLANVGSAPLPSGSDGIVDIYVNGTKVTWIKLSAVPTSLTGGGIYNAGGTSTYEMSTQITTTSAVKVVVDSTNTISESNETNNTLEVQLEPCAKLPDLTVSKIYCSGDNRVTVTLANIGKAPLPSGYNCTTDIYIDDTKVTSFNLTTPPISSTGGGIANPGGTSTYEMSTQIIKTSTIKVIVDSTNSIAESDETNNTMITKVEPCMKLPDLAVINASRTNTQICYTIKNVGQENIREEGGISISFYNSLVVDGKQVAEDHITETISIGQQVNRCFSYQLAPGNHVVKICADSRQNIKESNETNNCLEQTWTGEEKLPDLIVQNIQCSGEKILITVKNIGPGSLKTDLKDIINDVYFNGVKKDSFDLAHPLSPSSGGTTGGISDTGYTYSIPCQFITKSSTNTVKVVLDSANKVKESNEQNNYMEKKCECLKDVTPPIVTITYSLPFGHVGATSSDRITFKASAHDTSEVTKIAIYVNGEKVKECAPPSEKQGIKVKYWECEYTGGPYSSGTLKYRAEAFDIYGNKGVSEEETLNVECGKIDFAFSEGGRLVTSGVPIFCLPDEDGDGINDCWENNAMEALNPYIELDEEEDEQNPYDHVANFVRVTPYPDAKNPKFILFYYIVTWARDYGRFGFESHAGDTEPLVMAWQVINDQTIQLKCIYIEAHGGCNKRTDIWQAVGESCNENGICDFVQNTVGTQRLCATLEFRNNRLLLYASEDKHALYPTCQVCETTTIVHPTMDVKEGEWLESIANVIDSVIQDIWNAICWVFDQIVKLFTWWKDDFLGTQVAVWDYVKLRDTPGVSPVYKPGEEAPLPRIERELTFKGGDYEYKLRYHIEKDFTNAQTPHIRIIIDDLYCVDETNPEEIWFFGWHNWIHDSPYVIITGFSVYPEGITTWRVGEPRFEQVDDNEDKEINMVVYDGNITQFYIIGFNVLLYEDDGTTTGGGDRRNRGEDMANKLREKLSSEEAPCEECGEECGENTARLIRNLGDIGEDCASNGKTVYRFRVYNVGEPDEKDGEYPHLLINDLTNCGFPGEYVDGHTCVDKDGNRHFCGGYSCNSDCGTSILEWIKDISCDHFTRLYEELNEVTCPKKP